MKLSFLHFISSVSDKLDLYVSCECAGEGGERGGGGGEDLKLNVSSQLWVLMLCVVQLIMQTLPSKIFWVGV